MFGKKPKRITTRPASQIDLHLESLERRVMLAVFTVNSLDDVSDGVCDAVHCSLREAIMAANANGAGAIDTIEFDIAGAGPHIIMPNSPLPEITTPVAIVGSSEPDFAGTPIVVVDGSNAGIGADGLTVTGGNSTIRSLVIQNFAGSGVVLRGGGNNSLKGNYLGTDTTGLNAQANGLHGLLIDNSAGNTIGSSFAVGRNLISGNQNDGIHITGASSTGNVIVGNYIGLGFDGLTAVGNGDDGVRVGAAASQNKIGRSSASSRNVISANGGDGIELNGATTSGNIVLGNFIGTDASGAVGRGNASDGIELQAATNNSIGGAFSGAGNVISGNANNGIEVKELANGNTIRGNTIGTTSDGNTALGNLRRGVQIDESANNLVGGTSVAARNVIAANGIHGLHISGVASTGNIVVGNFVGTNAAGTLALGNSQNGVHISGAATNNRIGGASSAQRNLISGNGGSGVGIRGGTTAGNVVRGNYIGTDTAGAAPIGNVLNGITLDSASQNAIGGSFSGSGNLVSGNGGVGIQLIESAASNRIRGNFVGTSASGSSVLGNTGAGIELLDADRNVIGGSSAGSRNVVSGNGSIGILISGQTSIANRVRANFVGVDVAGSTALGNGGDGLRIEDGASRNLIGGQSVHGNVISGNQRNGVELNGGLTRNNFVRSNRIGTDATGTMAIPNVFDGVELDGSSDNTIGGIGLGNTISGNGDDGVELVMGAARNVIRGNRIGTDANASAPLSNGNHGIAVGDGAHSNKVGGSSTADGNTIAHNGASGVRVLPEAGQGNLIRKNAIYNNTELGIDLGSSNVTSNDVGDVDTGGNDVQNFPVLTSVAVNPTTVIVQGTLSSTPNTRFSIDLYHSASSDPSGFGEGENYFRTFLVTTDATGVASFSRTTAITIPVGNFVSATATDPSGSTSEFSASQTGSALRVKSMGATTADPTILGLARLKLLLSDGSFGSALGAPTDPDDLAS